MFKEAFVGLIVVFLFYLLCRLLWNRRSSAMSPFVIALLLIGIIANGVYAFCYTFPHFYMDTVGGVFRYGTFEGNLFAYSDEFMIQDEIIFPVLRGRHVSLDAAGDFYEKFVSLYAASYDRLEVPPEKKQLLLARQDDFDFVHEFSCIGIMDYVTDGIPAQLQDSFEEEIYTTLYINTNSLQGSGRLVALMDTDYSLYVMSEDYYTEITGGNRNE